MVAGVLKAAAFIVTSVSAAAVRPGTFGCGTPDPSQEQRYQLGLLAAQEAAAGRQGNSLLPPRPPPPPSPIVIPTWFHVLASSTKLEDGYLSVCLNPT